MSKFEHTPGRVQLEGNWSGENLGGRLSTTYPMPLFELTPVVGRNNEIAANAHRIVCTWNACNGAGLTNAALDAGVISDLIEAWVELFAAKDQLLELERNNDTTKRFDAALRDEELAESKARAALALARGEPQP